MNIPFVDLNAQHAEVVSELQSAIDAVMSTSAFTGGPQVERFEKRYADYCGTRHCVAVGSGTAALELLMRAYEIGPGDEVILPANTFVATAEAVALAGAKPVFVDVRDDTANLNPHQLAAALSPATKAIIAVHLYGVPADIDAIGAFAREHDLILLEDAAQAHGAEHRRRRAGSLGDAAAFSFYPSKNLGACGEAGCITTDDPAIAESARMLRDHGSKEKYRHDIVGRNDRIDGIQAAILSVKLKRLDRWNHRRGELAARYDEAFTGHPLIHPLHTRPECKAVHHLYVVRVQDRDRVRQALASDGIATGIHYPIPLHLQPAFASLGGAPGDLPVCESLADEVLSLPMFPHLDEAQVDYVCESLAGCLEGVHS